MINLLINKTQKSDISTIVSMEQDSENSQFIFPNSADEHINLLLDENIEHLLLKSENNETIGFVILAGLRDKNRSIEFRRIVINQKGKGFGRKAIQEIKRFCFKEMKCHRLWLDVLENNERAVHLYQSEGFKEEGKLRESILIDNKFIGLIIMSILEREYKN